MKTYKATGLVHGYYWGGGEGAYRAETVYAETREDLLEELNYMLDSGELDAGMGYESLIGALLTVTEIETITRKGKSYSREEHEDIFIGSLTDAQKRFLEHCQEFG